jgi:DNA modification methylase
LTVRILQGDCREVMATLPECSVDAIVTDPPYDLTAGKKGGSGAASVNLDSPYGRARIGTGTWPGGFMGMKWDGTGVAFDAETWRQALRVLKPGGHLIAFSGTRTYHRMVCAVEDAGFEIRDQIGWLYGSGFPKSRNLDGDWQGWGTALKPAWEPIVMARKPLVGTVAANVLVHGTGAINVDACRVGDEAVEKGRAGRGECESNALGKRLLGTKMREMQVGRWPANIVHDGSVEVIAAFPREAGAASPVRGTEASRASVGNVTGERNRVPGAFHADSGSAARFFYTAKASASERADGLHTVTQRGRNHHPTVKPTDLMRWLCRLVTPPGGTVLDPFMGSGSTLKAAELEGFSAIGIELDPAYIEIAKRRIASDAPLFAEVL